MMNGDQLAVEMIQAMGGRVTPARLKAFKAMAGAIVRHIQKNMVVAAAGTAAPSGDTVTTTSVTVQ